MLALTYVKNMRPRDDLAAVCFNLIPGVGEYFVFPALTTSGPCEIMVFEGVPGGPMDCWGDVKTPEQHLAKSKWILETYLPWEAERCHENRVDRCKWHPDRLSHSDCSQTRRHSSLGQHVLGMADAVVLNDPITGQGSNNAAQCADIYLKSIRIRPASPANRMDAANLRSLLDRLCALGHGVDQSAAASRHRM